ncbi:MAG: TetR/AcrR family transcriptional regulator [Desulfobacterales bacterium]|nr:TetR/AcrR family transcriptional regulator [Desulfobacterales bacterium]
MSPKIINREKRTAEITRAALDVFSVKGYSAASVGQIAATAKIAKGTIYEYFETKEDLYIAAVMLFVDGFQSSLKSLLENIDDPLTRLITFTKSSLDICDRNDAETTYLFVDILQQSLLKNGVFYNRRYLVREMLLGFRKIITNILLDGVSKGIFKPEIAKDAEKIATNLLAFLDGASLHTKMTENYFDIPSQLDYFMQYLTQSILLNPENYDLNATIAEQAGN